MSEFGAPTGWRLVPPPGILLARLVDGLSGRQLIRPRRKPTGLRIDDNVEGWRVVCLELTAGHRLQAVRHVGGAAWMALLTESAAESRSRLLVRLYFAPWGFVGLL